MSQKVTGLFRLGFLGVLAAVLFLAVDTAGAQEAEKLVRLKDGTVLRGTFVSDARGVYRITTRMMGDVLIDPTEIVSIQTVEPSPHGLAAGSGSQAQGEACPIARINKLKADIMANPDVMASIEKITHDEKVTALAQDTAFREALRSGDMEALKDNESFQAFVDSPAVQEIIEKIGSIEQGAQDE
jgi:hypothetical protein